MDSLLVSALPGGSMRSLRLKGPQPQTHMTCLKFGCKESKQSLFNISPGDGTTDDDLMQRKRRQQLGAIEAVCLRASTPCYIGCAVSPVDIFQKVSAKLSACVAVLSSSGSLGKEALQVTGTRGGRW